MNTAFKTKYQTPLTLAQAVAKAPSIAATTAAPGVSDRYQHIPTTEVLEVLEKAGFCVVQADQSVCKTPGKEAYMKHVVRLQPKKMDHLIAGDTVGQIIVTNSHDRTSAFNMMCGLYRLWCGNGMASPVGDMAAVRVMHTDKAFRENIMAGVDLITEVIASVVTPQIERMEAKTLTIAQAREFALGASLLKWGSPKEDQVEALLDCRRDEDDGMSMWKVLNRIQENAVKGGYATQDAAGRNVKARGIKSVDRDLDFNVKLWTMGARVLELVGG